MITVVVDYLNELLRLNLPVLAKRHGLVEQLQFFGDEPKTFPAIYEGAGDSDHINLDFNTATVYHRQTGESTEDIDIEQAPVGGEDFTVKTTPMRCVAYFKKSLYNTDTSSIALKVAQNIRNVFKATNIKTLSSALGVDYVSVQTDSIQTDPYQVWEEEFEGVRFAVPSDHALIAIDYTVEIGAMDSCFTTYGCNDVDFVISGGVIESEITITSGVLLINATLPAVGQSIIDVDSINVGTLISTSEIFIPELSSYGLKDFFVKVDELWLKWLNADDVINDIDDSLSTAGTIKLFPGRNLFQPGAELRILLKTAAV